MCIRDSSAPASLLLFRFFVCPRGLSPGSRVSRALIVSSWEMLSLSCVSTAAIAEAVVDIVGRWRGLDAGFAFNTFMAN